MDVHSTSGETNMSCLSVLLVCLVCLVLYCLVCLSVCLSVLTSLRPPLGFVFVLFVAIRSCIAPTLLHETWLTSILLACMAVLEDLFSPPSAHALSLDGAVAAGSLLPGLARPGRWFAAAKFRFVSLQDSGQGTMSVPVVTLQEGRGDDQLTAYWVLKEFYFKLGYSSKVHLDDYLRRVKSRWLEVLPKYEVGAEHFVPSQKMYEAQCDLDGVAVDEEVLHQEHYKEVLCSSVYLILFVAV
jgi:hypothetical protein